MLPCTHHPKGWWQRYLGSNSLATRGVISSICVEDIQRLSHLNFCQSVQYATQKFCSLDCGENTIIWSDEYLRNANARLSEDIIKLYPTSKVPPPSQQHSISSSSGFVLSPSGFVETYNACYNFNVNHPYRIPTECANDVQAFQFDSELSKTFYYNNNKSNQVLVFNELSESTGFQVSKSSKLCVAIQGHVFYCVTNAMDQSQVATFMSKYLDSNTNKFIPSLKRWSQISKCECLKYQYGVLKENEFMYMEENSLYLFMSIQSGTKTNATIIEYIPCLENNENFVSSTTNDGSLFINNNKGWYINPKVCFVYNYT